MNREVRYLTPADYPAYAEVAAYSYNLTPKDITKLLEPAEQSGGLPVGAFADGRLAAAMLDRRFEVNVNGAFVRANGIGMVASSPETRRHGLVRDMLGWHLAELRRAGVVLSLLYPFEFRFYNRMGWGFASRMLQATIPVREFAGYGRDVGRMCRLGVCDKDGFHPESEYTRDEVVAAMNDIYMTQARGHNLIARREPRDWHRMLRIDEGRRYVYGWRSDAGRIEGYVMVMTRGDEYPNDLRVREMIGSTPDAWRGLFWYLSCHDSHIKNIRLMLHPDDQILELLSNPRIDAKLEHGPMARAVDAAGLLQARGTEDIERGSCTIQVMDELCEWNDGWFAVSFDGDSVKAEKLLVDPGAADVVAPIDVFSRLAVGARSLDEMMRFGLAQAASPGPGLDFARSLFPARPVLHKEYY